MPSFHGASFGHRIQVGTGGVYIRLHVCRGDQDFAPSPHSSLSVFYHVSSMKFHYDRQTFSNGGVRSVGNGLTVNGCTFTGTSAVEYDGADPGSALQVYNSDLVITDTAFRGNKGTPLYVESSVQGASHTVEVSEGGCEICTRWKK